MLIGYARVSTKDQNLDLQRDALQAASCSRIFEKKESGRAGTKRPALEGALDFLRIEDQLVVWKIDRLGRFLTPGTLLAVMAVAITRALTALSARRAIDEASGHIQEAAKVLDVAAGATIPSDGSYRVPSGHSRGCN